MKYPKPKVNSVLIKSPSMRREWIEIESHASDIYLIVEVSLHAEGVD